MRTTPGGTYVFTVVTERRQPVLIRTALREGIVLVGERLPFCSYGWILLAGHLHAI